MKPCGQIGSSSTTTSHGRVPGPFRIQCKGLGALGGTEVELDRSPSPCPVVLALPVYAVGLCPVSCGAVPTGKLGPRQFAALCTRMPGAQTPQQWDT